MCNNFGGGFSCSCQSGFETVGADEITCHNIDECIVDEPCGDHAQCFDTVGSFICTCDDGYHKDNQSRVFKILSLTEYLMEPKSKKKKWAKAKAQKNGPGMGPGMGPGSGRLAATEPAPEQLQGS